MKDAEILHHILQNNRAIFKQVYERWYVSLCTYAMRFEHDQDEAAELAEKYQLALIYEDVTDPAVKKNIKAFLRNVISEIRLSKWLVAKRFLSSYLHKYLQRF